jgi:hypothetical protein
MLPMVCIWWRHEEEGATHGVRRRGRCDHFHLRRGAIGPRHCQRRILRRREEGATHGMRQWGWRHHLDLWHGSLQYGASSSFPSSPSRGSCSCAMTLSMLGSCCRTHGVMRFDSDCLGEQVSGTKTWRGSSEYEIAWQASLINFGIDLRLGARWWRASCSVHYANPHVDHCLHLLDFVFLPSFHLFLSEFWHIKLLPAKFVLSDMTHVVIQNIHALPFSFTMFWSLHLSFAVSTSVHGTDRITLSTVRLHCCVKSLRLPISAYTCSIFSILQPEQPRVQNKVIESS